MTIEIKLSGKAVTIDPERLSLRARALAEAIAASPSREPVDIWLESDRPVRELVADWEHWYTPEEADRPDRRPWRGWTDRETYRTGDDPHQRLEYEAGKIPPGWHVLGAHPARPVASAATAATAREATSDQVVAYIEQHGGGRMTAHSWRARVLKGEAPAALDRPGRTKIWSLDDVDVWLADPRRRGPRPSTA